MPLRRRILPFLFVLLVFGALVGASHDLVAVTPLALLLLPIAWGRYIGERTIDRWRALRAAPAGARRHRVVAAALPHVVRAIVPRGTALLGFHRAVRPPPTRARARLIS